MFVLIFTFTAMCCETKKSLKFNECFVSSIKSSIFLFSTPAPRQINTKFAFFWMTLRCPLIFTSLVCNPGLSVWPEAIYLTSLLNEESISKFEVVVRIKWDYIWNGFRLFQSINIHWAPAYVSETMLDIKVR